MSEKEKWYHRLGFGEAPKPTPQTLRDEMLSKARIDLIDHESKAEYHQAMAAMLQARIARLTYTPGTLAVQLVAQNQQSG